MSAVANEIDYGIVVLSDIFLSNHFLLHCILHVNLLFYYYYFVFQLPHLDRNERVNISAIVGEYYQ